MWSTMILRFPARAQFLSQATLVAAGMAAFAAFSGTSAAQCEETPKVALSPKEFRSFTVRKVEDVNHNTKRVTFALPSAEHEMGVTTTSCLMARAKVDGKTIARPYTPTNVNDEKGFLELVVKGYPQGKLSKHIVELKEGDSLDMKGPFPKFNYYPNSVSEEDIILREEVEAMMYLYPQISVVHVLSNPSAEWKGLTGFVSKEMVEKYMPEPSDDHLVCVCGPPPMMYHVSGDKAKDRSQGELQGLLKDLNYISTQVFKF
ncbi:hypothetical protein KRP22_007209 [Phytophthora ramorum]|nr:NADH-cytochrome b5 reductase-like protein [Phytophthora ramorum]